MIRALCGDELFDDVDAQTRLTETTNKMIIDCHGHYTTAPKQLEAWRKRQIAELEDSKHVPSKGSLGISDDEIRASLEGAQLKLQRERGTDITHLLAARDGHEPSHRQRDHKPALVRALQRVDPPRLHSIPEKFVGVCQLPQSPGVLLRTALRSWSAA